MPDPENDWPRILTEVRDHRARLLRSGWVRLDSASTESLFGVIVRCMRAGWAV